MPVGLACYRDGSAVPFFDTYSGFILGQASINLGAGGSGGATDANLLNGTPFFFQLTQFVNNELLVTFSGADIDWTAPTGWNGTLYWGIG
jgi:hypothetical protein